VNTFLNNNGKWIITLLLFVIFWLIFTEMQLASFIVGVFFILAAVVVSNFLTRVQIKAEKAEHSIQWLAIPRFVVFFLVQSIIGGIDTAKHAFSPTLKMSPGFAYYKLNYLTQDINTDLFFNLLSLLPGSLYVTNEKEGIVIHFLSLNESSLASIVKCEQAVATLYNINCTNTHQGKT